MRGMGMDEALAVEEPGTIVEQTEEDKFDASVEIDE